MCNEKKTFYRNTVDDLELRSSLYKGYFSRARLHIRVAAFLGGGFKGDGLAHSLPPSKTTPF